MIDEKKSKEKILLHTCCAVCFGYPSQLLKFLGHEVIAYFYNPNIHPEAEFLRRREELERFCEKYNFELIIEDYTPCDFDEIVKGLENESEKGARCKKCFDLRLLKTAKKAKELKIPRFTTTLTVSPHKNSEQVFDAGVEAQMMFEQDGVEFAQFDFKKNNGAKLTNEIARHNELYRQDYCGCLYSIKN